MHAQLITKQKYSIYESHRGSQSIKARASEMLKQPMRRPKTLSQKTLTNSEVNIFRVTIAFKEEYRQKKQRTKKFKKIKKTKKKYI